MNAPVTPPDYQHSALFPQSQDETPYRKLTSDHVKTAEFNGEEVLMVEPEGLRLLAEEAFKDINHYLRPGHLEQLKKILDDPEATENDKFVAFDLLKNRIAQVVNAPAGQLARVFGAYADKDEAA